MANVSALSSCQLRGNNLTPHPLQTEKSQGNSGATVGGGERWCDGFPHARCEATNSQQNLSRRTDRSQSNSGAAFIERERAFDAHYPKFSEMILDDLKLSQTIPNDPKCSQIIQTDPKFSQMIQKLSHMIPNVLKWSKTIPNYPKCSQMF